MSFFQKRVPPTYVYKHVNTWWGTVYTCGYLEASITPFCDTNTALDTCIKTEKRLGYSAHVYCYVSTHGCNNHIFEKMGYAIFSKMFFRPITSTDKCIGDEVLSTPVSIFMQVLRNSLTCVQPWEPVWILRRGLATVHSWIISFVYVCEKRNVLKIFIWNFLKSWFPPTHVHRPFIAGKVLCTRV